VKELHLRILFLKILIPVKCIICIELLCESKNLATQLCIQKYHFENKHAAIWDCSRLFTIHSKLVIHETGIFTHKLMRILVYVQYETSYKFLQQIGSCAGVGKRGSRSQAWLLISLIIRSWRCLRVSGMIQIIAHHIHTVVQNDIIILHSYKTASFFVFWAN